MQLSMVKDLSVKSTVMTALVAVTTLGKRVVLVIRPLILRVSLKKFLFGLSSFGSPMKYNKHKLIWI